MKITYPPYRVVQVALYSVQDNFKHGKSAAESFACEEVSFASDGDLLNDTEHKHDLLSE